MPERSHLVEERDVYRSCPSLSRAIARLAPTMNALDGKEKSSISGMLAMKASRNEYS